MLSPGVRQVTHALLTRPPLKCHKIWPKSHQRGISVRLACVKHAASVHPEPGSNSLKKVILIRVKISLAFFLPFIYCLFVSFDTLLKKSQIPFGDLEVNFVRNLLRLFGIFSGLHYCLFVKVQHITLPTQRININTTVLHRQPPFFIFSIFSL